MIAEKSGITAVEFSLRLYYFDLKVFYMILLLMIIIVELIVFVNI